MESRARAALKELVEKQHGGNVSAAARDLGVSQPSLAMFLGGKRGFGASLVEAMSRRYPTELAAILGTGPRPSPPPRPPGPPTRTGDPTPANPPGIPDGSPVRPAQGRAVELARQLLAELGEAPPTTVVLDARYPNREAAIDALVDAGQLTREEAEAAAPVALESEDDLPLLEWVEIIRGAHLAARRGRAGRRMTDKDF